MGDFSEPNRTGTGTGANSRMADQMSEEARDWGRFVFGLVMVAVGVALTIATPGGYGIAFLTPGVSFTLIAVWRIFDARRVRRMQRQ